MEGEGVTGETQVRASDLVQFISILFFHATCDLPTIWNRVDRRRNEVSSLLFFILDIYCAFGVALFTAKQ